VAAPTDGNGSKRRTNLSDRGQSYGFRVLGADRILLSYDDRVRRLILSQLTEADLYSRTDSNDIPLEFVSVGRRSDPGLSK
jgi:hypothetical protein